MDKPAIPAAQYLRMSTENQQYSLHNQSDAITRYAAEHGFSVVTTYTDAAKSGLRLKNRFGLRRLLKDVVDGGIEFRAVLVYDVSRWGRFQDTDESAHYEYLCKSAGIPVHYCAEQFLNDNSMGGFIFKALKRSMAAEYSRELSVRVRAGSLRLARLGYKQGGQPPYGMRRLLLDATGKQKQLLADGERKSIVSERVILVPGPPDEVATVRRIFHEFVNEGRSLRSIATRLNEEGVPFIRGSKWDATTVTHLLERANYIGVNVWGRTTAHLSTPVRHLPMEKWAICPDAFEPIVTRALFYGAQAQLANITCRLTNAQLLERLRAVMNSNGTLRNDIIHSSELCPGASTYWKRFGGLLKAYAQLGFDKPELNAAFAKRQRIMLLRRRLIESLIAQFPDRLEEVRLSRRFRSKLRDRRTGLLIAVTIARCFPRGRGGLRWLVDYLDISRRDRNRVTVLALLNPESTEVHSLKVFRKMDFQGRSIFVREGSEWLSSGLLLERLGDLFSQIGRVRRRGSR